MSVSNLPILTEDTTIMDHQDRNASLKQESSIVTNPCSSNDSDNNSCKSQD